jgi:cysteinyl-tRNA synthetase
MENQIAIEALLKERDKLTTEQAAMNAKFTESINSIETSIERLSGKEVWEAKADFVFDDENPDYIRSSQEEL